MILHLFLILPAFTVITAVPFFFAVTFPFAVTVATFLFEEVNVTFSSEVIGRISGISVHDFFLRMVSFFWIPWIFVVFTAVF